MASAVAVLFVTVIKVLDGDSIQVSIPDCGMAVLCEKISVRLQNFDTPELFHPKCPKEKDLAIQAKKIVEEAFPVGSTMVLSNPKRDKYFRLLAESKALETRLIKENLAVPYHGEHKNKDWCS